MGRNDYTAANHILRLLLGGLPGGARWRGDEDRAQRACVACGEAATWAWTTARGGEGGLAWCRSCSGPWHGSQGWAALPDSALPAELLPAAARLRETRPALALAAGWRPGPHGACPLCGLG